MGKSPEPLVVPAKKRPGRDEPPVRAEPRVSKLHTMPGRMGEPHAGRPGRPGADIEDSALGSGDHGSAVRGRAIVHEAESGGYAGTEYAGVGDRPAVDLAI